MADETDDWFGAADDDPAPPESSRRGSLLPPGVTEEDLAKLIEGAKKTAGEGGESPAGEPKPQEDQEFLDPDKLLLFKHWIRPKFLQYGYLYDYRRNYYDDVIDFLDKKQKGFRREVPRAQTWAERVLRTYNSKINKTESFKKALEDTKLVVQTALSGKFHLHHSKQYINRRYTLEL